MSEEELDRDAQTTRLSSWFTGKRPTNLRPTRMISGSTSCLTWDEISQASSDEAEKRVANVSTIAAQSTAPTVEVKKNEGPLNLKVIVNPAKVRIFNEV